MEFYKWAIYSAFTVEYHSLGHVAFARKIEDWYQVRKYCKYFIDMHFITFAYVK